MFLHFLLNYLLQLFTGSK